MGSRKVEHEESERPIERHLVWLTSQLPGKLRPSEFDKAAKWRRRRPENGLQGLFLDPFPCASLCKISITEVISFHITELGLGELSYNYAHI